MKMSRMMCQHGRTALVATALLAVSAAQAFTLVGPGAQARVVVDPLPDCVWRAAQDLTNDVKKVTGTDLPLVRGAAVQPGDVHVAVKPDGRWEAYSVREQGGVLEIAGSDARGAMFGVYDFIERYLGVDPMYFWSGVPHPKRAELAWKKVEIVQGEPSFRFRGWFLNDEDLLTKWREASGVRDYSQYRYYHDVVNHGAMEAVAEALVRARMNLIIPASFLNATRPAEEGLAAICAARGVFVSMHHIEPMGVSGYTFKDYWKQRGRDLEYSYFKYPREVEEVWRALATRWAKFPNVVWQIGLRGTGDRPMWADDPTMPKDDAGRARLITAALERQLAILDEIGVPREGRHVTTTLWGEGAYFHAKGLLKIPAGTTVVYADNNCGWRWQRDLLDARPPADGERRGVYYHHQLIGMGPHLVSLVPAARTCAMLRGARAKGACDYAIFNMGNVREFVYGIDATAKMTWNIDAFDPEAWTKAWIARRLGSNAAAWNDAVNLHYKSLQLHPETGVPCFLDGLMQSQYRRHVGAVKRLLSGKELRRPLREPFANAFKGKDVADPFFAALSDTYPVFASNHDTYMRLAAQRAGFEQTLRLAQRALAETAPAERPFAEDFVVYPARLMVGLTTARMEGIDAEDALRAGDPDAAAGHLRRAADALRDVIAAGKAYCHGKWADWYRGCEKVSPEAMLAFTEEVLAAFPPICRVASAEEWTRDVRPRVIEFFDANVYGQLPPKPAKLSFDLVERGPAFGGAAERRQYVVRSADACGEHAFDVLVYLPAGKGTVPAFVYPNFSGNHSLVDDPAVRVFDGHPFAGKQRERGARMDRAPVEEVVRRGFAFATFCYGAIYPDYTPTTRDAAPDSVWNIFPKERHPQEILAHPTWSWGSIRVRDLLETLPEIDQGKVAIAGQSRMGKNAIETGVHDARFALVCANCGGTKSIKFLPNLRYPHWFSGKIKPYVSRDKLSQPLDTLMAEAAKFPDPPFDQSAFVACIAPRALVISSATEDRTSPPAASRMLYNEANHVFRLFGKSIGWHVKAGPHSITHEDWRAFMDYARTTLKW